MKFSQMKRIVPLVVAIGLGLAAVCPAAKQESPRAPQEVDLSIWRSIPVFHHGRVMPLDTLAKVAGETISGSGSSVKIELDAYYTQEQLKNDPRLKPALEMFPGGKMRRVPVEEMLLSWLIEPKKWEDVPFILCEHKDLHKLLGVESITKADSKDETGVHRKFVTPRMIAQSRTLRDYAIDFQERRLSARTAERKFKPSELDKKVRGLLDRYAIFRKLSLDPRLPLRNARITTAGGRDEFAAQFHSAKNVIMAPNETQELSMLDSLREFIRFQDQLGGDTSIKDAAQLAIAAMAQVDMLESRMQRVEEKLGGEVDGDEQVEMDGSENASDETPLTLDETEKAVVQLRLAAARLHDVLQREKGKAFDEDRTSESLAAAMQPVFDELEDKSEKLTELGLQMHLALYDNGAQFHGSQEAGSDEFRYGASVYVTPALNAAALVKERDPMSGAEPWITLQAVLYGSDDLLLGKGWPDQNYNRAQIHDVRAAWSELADAYTGRDSDSRAEDVDRAQAHLARTLRALGEGVEADRIALLEKQLRADQRDDELIEYTKYPPDGRLDAELTYNRVKPFRWSWVLCLMGIAAFSLSFGVMKKRAFWVGVAVLGATVLWTAFGFYLRICVTGWAPVTNMYETVVFVPWVLLVLALWFMLLPVTWNGIKDAWRLTAIPFAWEASELDERQRGMLGAFGWTVFGYLSMAGRIVLMAAVFYQLGYVPYGDGGRAVFELRPPLHVLDLSSISNITMILGVYLIGLICFAGAVWFVPRLLIAAAISLAMIPLSWFRTGDEASVRKMLAGVYNRRVFGIAGVAVACFLFLIAAYSPPAVVDEDFRPLQPVLRSNFWLTIHVLTIVSSYGAGMLAWGLGLIGLGHYLFGKYRDPVVATNVPKGMQPVGGGKENLRMGRLPPEQCATLANYAYRAVQVAVLLLAGGTILGGLWADVSWGRFWGWDPKEVWALISALVYLAILHGRYAGWFKNFGMTAGTVVGAIMIGLSWYGVNFILPMISPDGTAGLHSYGAGAGGQVWVFTFMGLNVLYLIAAGVRYRLETRAAYAPVEHTPEVPAVFKAQLTSGE